MKIVYDSLMYTMKTLQHPHVDGEVVTIVLPHTQMNDKPMLSNGIHGGFPECNRRGGLTNKLHQPTARAHPVHFSFLCFLSFFRLQINEIF